jgi:hypothetical protein
LNQFSIISALFIVIAFWIVSALPAFAGTPAGCTDLDGFPEQQAVDFESRIQPIFSVCAGCHGEGGSAGLDLRPGQAYDNLVGVESTTNPPQARVQPFEPGDSLLLSAVNCATTGGPSFQMPGTDPDQRALIRDWIAQGALERPAPLSIPVLNPIGGGIFVVLAMLVLLASKRQRARFRA